MSRCVSGAAGCVLGYVRGAFAGALGGAFWVRSRCVLGVCALPPYPYVLTPLQVGRCTYCSQGHDRCANPTLLPGRSDLKRPAPGAPLNAYEIDRNCDKLSHPPGANVVTRPPSPAATSHATPDARFWVSAPSGPASTAFLQSGARGVSWPKAEHLSAHKVVNALIFKVVRAVVRLVLQTRTQKPPRLIQNQPVGLERRAAPSGQPFPGHGMAQ